MMTSWVALDSNSLSYLVDVMSSGQKPNCSLADQKIALLRIYLYRNEVLFLPPTVAAEYKRIKDDALERKHSIVRDRLLIDVPKSDLVVLKSRISKYSEFHPGAKNRKDCQILAEAELGGCPYLLTYDSRFLSNLKGKTQKIRMLTPLEFWDSLNIPRGSQPRLKPHSTNPLSKETWWIW